MQDEAPPHWSTIVRDWLNEKLLNRWIGRGADTDLNIKWLRNLVNGKFCLSFLLQMTLMQHSHQH